MSTILRLLQLEPPPQSIDFIEDKRQFHLSGLVTEQRHPKTWNLSFAIQSDTQRGLGMLLSVDGDITTKIEALIGRPGVLNQAVQSVAEAIVSRRRIYVYGCGSTGRLSKQMESAFWRPFWRKVMEKSYWDDLRDVLPEDIDDLLVGEMTGGDRALVSSLEGFEDLRLVGELQLQDRQVRAGDVVFCVTEGGETSSVIGTIMAALDQYRRFPDIPVEEVRRHLYFVYNNPDEVLLSFSRSALVLNSPHITKINLTTGPQAITGSTRMQATTIETFVIGAVLEQAIFEVLSKHLSGSDLTDLGYAQGWTLQRSLGTFPGVKAAVDVSLPKLAQCTDLEAATYRRSCKAAYFAKRAVITVFIDSTERSPTFRLYPLDKIQDSPGRSWVQVWTEAADLRQAWRNMLGRPFRGLSPDFYRPSFDRCIEDPYLREAALKSLAEAGDDQELHYDFSLSEANLERRGPKGGDLAVVVTMDEEIREVLRPGSGFHRFLELLREAGAPLVVLSVADRSMAEEVEQTGLSLGAEALVVPVLLDASRDPLGLRRQVALKMLLNAHSTGVMALVGRVVGNTMTSVSPSNLKLVGRATLLTLTHVNDILVQPEWIHAHGPTRSLSYSEANAVLFDALKYVRSQAAGQTAEVALSIIRIVEALRLQSNVSWEHAREILEREELAAYLERHNPSLRYRRQPADF